MDTNAGSATSSFSASESPASPASDVPGVVFPQAMLAVYWAAVLFVWLIEIPYFFRFLFGMAAPFLFLIAFSIWWWRRRSLSVADRALGFAMVFGGAFAFAPLTHPSLGLGQNLMIGLPVVMSIWIVWTLAAGRTSVWPRAASIPVALAAWAIFLLFRVEGVDGDLRGDYHWRWTPTAEELFLAGQPAATKTAVSVTPETEKTGEQAPVIEKLNGMPGDWTEFRGPGRTGTVKGVKLVYEWQTPPKLLWKQRIGPAWSSVIIVGERLFTQEQRGEQEAVVCYEASTGKQLWVHEDTDRFWEAVSGAGPRGTPTFADGRIVTLGGRGILNSLDAVTGKLYWTHNLMKENNAQIPMWGISSSPVVVDGKVIAYGGGANQNNLLAYDAETGAPLWTAAAGSESYSSPQVAVLDGQTQVLMFSDAGVIGFDPATGKQLWQGGAVTPNPPRAMQVHPLDNLRILAGTLQGIGVGMIELTHNTEGWKSAEVWTSTEIKPEFGELVVHEGHAYGFDGAIFSCIDLATGKRKWKSGRYGRGQVILVADSARLVVLGEFGDAVMLAANPEKREELGKFKAIEGKCWNHPVIAHGRIYFRNAEEIACYELAK